ncbi:MAG: pantoate--beta-alanine ligase, partial [Bacteroidales bacterium]|nr:pantoate--beta-alanine ligase [Bacteroidales bacterium]
MKQVDSAAGLKNEISRLNGRSIGMVPTMGALHAGHVSLVKRSVDENDITLVSIFVNPAQFNDVRDLEKYPRTMNADLALLSDILGPDDIVFTPEADDIYRDEQLPGIDLGHLATTMEGEHRPGHFMGVVRIVKILFDLCRPHRAYFGRKDFQQLAVIRTMAEQSRLKTEIIGCPIIREANGLAMSSRNSRLSPVMREKAGIIFRTLTKYREQSLPFDVNSLKNKIISEINAEDNFNVEYFDIVDDRELIPVHSHEDIDPGK